MAVTNQERVGRALDLLNAGLAAFVEREIDAAVKAGAARMDTIRRFAEAPMLAKKAVSEWDAAGLLKLMWESWNDVFRRTLGRAERSLVREIRVIGTTGHIRTLSPVTMRIARSIPLLVYLLPSQRDRLKASTA